MKVKSQQDQQFRSLKFSDVTWKPAIYVRRRDQPAPQEDPPASQQQHQQKAYIRVSTHSLANIHERYYQVLQTMKENRCSMTGAFRLAGCPRSTLWDFVSIVELKKVDSRELDLVLRDQGVPDIGARSGGCLSQKSSALHPGHEQHAERRAAVANEVRGTILRVKYLSPLTKRLL